MPKANRRKIRKEYRTRQEVTFKVVLQNEQQKFSANSGTVAGWQVYQQPQNCTDVTFLMHSGKRLQRIVLGVVESTQEAVNTFKNRIVGTTRQKY